MDGRAQWSTRARRWLGAAAVLLGGAGGGCKAFDQLTMPSATTPSHGFLTVEVTTSGGDLDLDGYYLFVDETPGPYLSGPPAGSRSTRLYLRAGQHTVAITDVAPNCSVVGPISQTVAVKGGTTGLIQFSVVCVATGVAVTATATGVDIPMTFGVAADTMSPVRFATLATMRISRLAPGTHTISLLTPEHCTVAGSSAVAVEVTQSGLTPVHFVVTCTTVVRREKIAYVVANGASPIEMVNTDGSRVEQLDFRASAVKWARGGVRLVFSDAECYEGPWGWYYYGGDAYCIGGPVVVDPELGTSTRVAGAGFGFHPAWSPVRDELVVEVRPISSGTLAEGLELQVVDVAAATARPLTIPSIRSASQADWSPDGERLVFVCTGSGSGADLCFVNRDRTGFERLLTSNVAEASPAWSPDGKSIAFARFGNTPVGEIARLDLASGAVTPLGPGITPAWSPDGTRLVFAGGDGLFVMNADGSNRRRLTTGAHSSPAWRPLE